MATEHQPPDSQISTIPPPTATTTAPAPDPPPIDHPAPTTTATTNPPKRQRRPSVRLGEIGGDPPYEAHQRRPNKTWRFHKDPSFAAKNLQNAPPDQPCQRRRRSFWDQQRRASRARASESNGVHHNEVNSPEKLNEGNVGVREWLIGLGLVRYAPVFEIHEVDDEVLPMLTLEDLKDMGINAVGSRRKMYSAILKLRKGFS
ncbi:UNVERIFIED_CONTAM: hypothetical protein Sradi_6198600 [Sesamum radiatum]|uniref:SAM domain-containing protein n=1 Tax=Sesamum radiatum TaxID=300843 RepID=A0AAW2K8M6_SESRA